MILQFNDQTIDLIIRGKATTGNFGFSNYNDIVIQAAVRAGDAVRHLDHPGSGPRTGGRGLPGRAVGAVKAAVVAERNQALPPAQHALNEQLADA